MPGGEPWPTGPLPGDGGDGPARRRRGRGRHRHRRVGNYTPREFTQPKGTFVDRIDPRIWYAVAAVVVVLLLAWLLGWFGGAEAPPATPG